MADSKNPNTAKNDDNNNNFMEIDGLEDDKILSKSDYLTRAEVLKRRLRHCRQLDRCYRDHYWALMEDMKVQYRKYVWIHGKSPFKEDEEREEAGAADGVMGMKGENCNGSSNGNGTGTAKSGLGFERPRCAMPQCKTLAMELTRYCHAHILSDTKQTLYKPCTFVIKSAASGPILCGKPILITTVPSSCTTHLQNAEKHLARALKRAGLNASSSTRPAPKLHVVIAEYVRQIQMKRRAVKKRNVDVAQNKEGGTKVEIKREETS